MQELVQSPFFFLTLLICASGFWYLQNNWIKVYNYTIRHVKVPKQFDNYVIVQISDLHNKEFGKSNEGLLKKIRHINPDLIVITGDALNSIHDKGKSFLKLASVIGKEFKCVYIIGNHEQSTQFKDDGFLPVFLQSIKDKGITVLSNERLVLKKGSGSINIYGMWFNYKYYRNLRKPEQRIIHFKSHEMRNLLGKSDKDRFNVLLTHNPIYFDTYCKWGADLILTGHMHGGVINIPLIGGVLSPERVLFPKYYAGEYVSEESTMIVNRGLGGIPPVRLFNRPDLTVITLKT